MCGDVFGELIDQRELAHIELAGFDSHHPGLELGRPAKAHDDGGRRGEQLGVEAEPVATVLEPLLQAMRGCSVAMQRSAQGQHEANGGLVHCGRHGSAEYGAAPENTNARAATQAFARSEDPN